MTLMDLIKSSLEITGGTYDTLDEKEKSKLLSCAKMIYTELSEEYVKLKHTEELIATDGRIPYVEFSKPVKDIVRVEKNGRRVPFELFPDCVRCKAEGNVKVTYVYHAPDPDLEDELILPPFFNVTAISNGVASEFFYRSGLNEEALFYKNRYDNAVLNLQRRSASAYLQNRRFI